jgi:hypothetical protein
MRLAVPFVQMRLSGDQRPRAPLSFWEHKEPFDTVAQVGKAFDLRAFRMTTWAQTEEELNRDTKQILRDMRRYLKVNWGEKCPDYDKDCAQCRAWKAYDNFRKAVQ